VIAPGLLLLAASLLLALLHGDALGALLFALDGGLLPRLQAGVQRRLSPDLWAWGIRPIPRRSLVAPSALLPGLLGVGMVVGLGIWQRRRQASRSASATERSAAHRP